MTDLAQEPTAPAARPAPAPAPAPETYAGRGDEVTVVAYPNGPIIVRGPARLVTADGTPIQRRRNTVALCRCGTSMIKPYCDGLING